VCEVDTEQPEIGELDPTRLGNPNPNSSVVLQDALWRARDGEEGIFDVLRIVVELFGTMGIGEDDCLLVFMPGDKPVSAGPGLVSILEESATIWRSPNCWIDFLPYPLVV
jgi:hypothetical protein